MRTCSSLPTKGETVFEWPVVQSLQEYDQKPLWPTKISLLQINENCRAYSASKVVTSRYFIPKNNFIQEIGS